MELLRRFQGDPHVVQMRDFVFDTDRVLILMDLAVSDLQTFLKKQNYQLDIELLCGLWAALVDCLAAVSEKNVLHLDLKPHNFLLLGAPSGASWAGTS